jgi:hypothetical protein
MIVKESNMQRQKLITKIAKMTVAGMDMATLLDEMEIRINEDLQGWTTLQLLNEYQYFSELKKEKKKLVKHVKEKKC